MIHNEISAFLLKHKFDVNLSVNTLAQQILYDMELGLSGTRNGDKAGQDMFKTWILPPATTPAGKSVIVIDAGGTNFRSCLVTFGSDGQLSVSDFKKTCMPGVEKELSKKEFFAQIADNIDYLKNKSDRIGFCFSYAMSITKDGDGIPNAFSKEVKAPEVIGCPVGKTLVEELESRGWNKIQHIALLNDTVAALLAGRVSGKPGTEFSSYIGFILGTGINGAYIQPAYEGSGEKIDSQIIVTEAGKCDKIPLSDFDDAMDAKTAVPGQYRLEKQCSGGYLGSIGLEILLQAARENFFSEKTCSEVLKLQKLTLIQIDEFMYGPFKASLLGDLCAEECDRQKIYLLMDALIDRCAKNAAAILVAEAVQSGEGKNPVHPLGILCNGTTFYKTHKLYQRILAFLDEYLTKQRGIFYEILTVDNDITLGTAVAGLL